MVRYALMSLICHLYAMLRGMARRWQRARHAEARWCAPQHGAAAARVDTDGQCARRCAVYARVVVTPYAAAQHAARSGQPLRLLLPVEISARRCRHAFRLLERHAASALLMRAAQRESAAAAMRVRYSEETGGLRCQRFR